MRPLLVCLILIITLVVGVLILRLPPLAKGQAPEAVSVAKQIQPANPEVGDEVTVTLNVTGSNALCPAAKQFRTGRRPKRLNWPTFCLIPYAEPSGEFK